MSTASYAAIAVTARRASTCSVTSASAKSLAVTDRPRSRSHRVSGRSISSRPGGTGASVGSTDQTVSKSGTTSAVNGASISSTSWPRSVSSRPSGRTPPGTRRGPQGDHRRHEPRDAQPPRLAAGVAEERLARRQRRPVRVAGGRAGHRVEQRRRVPHGPGQHLARQPAHVAAHRTAADPPARRLETDQAAAAGRDAHRPAAVVAVGDRRQPRGHRRGCTPLDPPAIRSGAQGARAAAPGPARCSRAGRARRRWSCPAAPCPRPAAARRPRRRRRARSRGRPRCRRSADRR